MIKMSIKRPVLITVIFIIVLILGLISLSYLPIESFPNIEMPTVSIITAYPGASSSDVEEQVTKQIESSVAMVSDVKDVSSKSFESVSIVEVNFDWGKDIDEGVNDIRGRLDFVDKFLPEGTQKPIIFKMASSNAPVLVIGISNNQIPVSELNAYVDRYVLDRLRQVKGVGSVFSNSSETKKVNVTLNIPQMIKYNISVEQVKLALQANNLNIPLGEIREGKFAYPLRIPGEYKSIEEIRRTVVGMSGMRPVLLEDVANITFGAGYKTNVTTINGENGIVIICQKQANANTVKVADGVLKKLETIKNVLPQGSSVEIILDTSESVKNQINNLVTTVLYGFLFVVLIVFLFLRNIRGSFVISIAIPFSLIAAFMYLYFAGDSLNIISLASLSIAIGMVVDNSIVVIENIFRHRDKENEALDVAAERGTREVITAIMASTFTTIAIFVPLLFVQGFSSILFKQLAYTVSIVLIGSLFTSITLTPMLSSIVLRKRGHKKGKFEMKSEKWFEAVEEGYSKFLHFALNNKKYILITMFLIFFLSIFTAKGLKSEFMDMMSQNIIIGDVVLVPGLRIEQTDSLVNVFNERLKREIKELDIYSFQGGTSTTGSPLTLENTSYKMSFMATLTPMEQRDRTDREIIQQIRGIFSEYPEVKNTDFSTGGISSMMSQKQISIEIYGDNIDNIYNTAKEIEEKMKNIYGFVDINISRDEPIRGIAIVPRTEKMLMYGLNDYLLMNSLRTGLFGENVSVFRENGFEYDIEVRFNKKYISSFYDLYSLPVQTPMNKIIPLSAVASIERTYETPAIERKNRERLVKVESNIDGVSLSEAKVNVDKIISEINIKEGIRIKQAGDVESQKESFRDLGISILIGILLVFLVMAGQFESFIDPFIVLFSIPFAFVGVIWALQLTGTSLSIMCFIGMLMLVGIVVNNAIVLIDFINQLRRKRGLALEEAVKLAGKTRLRPVLMTAFTTIFGLLPLALKGGEGSEMWRPLGITVIGGLLISTIVTLILIPVIYSIFEKRIKKTS